MLGKVPNKCRLVCECHKKELILGIRVLQQCFYSILRAVKFVFHTSTYVKKDAHRDGLILHPHILDQLWMLVFEEVKIILSEPGNNSVRIVHYRHGYEDQIHSRANGSRWQRCQNERRHRPV